MLLASIHKLFFWKGTQSKFELVPQIHEKEEKLNGWNRRAEDGSLSTFTPIN